jgi:S1/P1 Nuclease
MRALFRSLAILATVAAGSPALAWGDLGHEVIGVIAYNHLTPTAKTRVDQLLASDTDTLTARDFASRTTWADKWRNSHRETAPWHFVDIEIDKPDLSAACFGFPPVPASSAASQGPSNDCVVDKISEFAAELGDPKTTPAERQMALKYVMHFVGDLHQPLHASDDNDKGGNCIGLSPSPDGRVKNLHAYWDVTVVDAIGQTPADIAAKLDAQITPAQVKRWSAGNPKAWAMESLQIAQRDAYKLPSRPTCARTGKVALSPDYQATAQADGAQQLKVAGIRLAFVLNQALGEQKTTGAPRIENGLLARLAIAFAVLALIVLGLLVWRRFESGRPRT